MSGADIVMLLRNGEIARGAVETIDGNVLVLRVTEAGSIRRRVAEEEIVCLARRVGKSTTARGWLGALIGAAVSLPFGISMAGDLMMPAAIAGALIAGNTGQPTARVILDRSHLAASEHACPGFASRHSRLTPREAARGPLVVKSHLRQKRVRPQAGTVLDYQPVFEGIRVSDRRAA
jgi:hypothetical protein